MFPSDFFGTANVTGLQMLSVGTAIAGALVKVAVIGIEMVRRGGKT
jgi:hypothetical protein